MKLRVLIFLACLVAITAVSPAFAGTVSNYYLTTISGPWVGGDPEQFTGRPAASTTFVIQGDQIVNQWVNTQPYEFGIAVAQDVRTAGYLWAGVGSLQGSQYTLGGDPIGGTCCTSPFQLILDSTTDGEFNYVVNFNDGWVYSTDRSYGNATRMFDTGGGFGGITYDPTNDSLWLSGFQGNGNATQVVDFSMSGVVQRSFSTGHSWNMALALDTATQYLWLMNGTGSGWTGAHYLEAWDKTGHQITSETIYTGDLTPGNMWMAFGGEMSTPEPTSFALIGAGVLALFLKRRR